MVSSQGTFDGVRSAEALPPASSYAVKLPAFEGPLDLLLHLIRLNEVEITDIPIASVAEQYLEYLELMHELDLDVAGEHLLMAATLAWIKSRMLLPPDGAEDDDEAVDPRAELVARLLEYQRFREVAGDLGERPLLGRDVFDAKGPPPEPVPDGEREIEVGLFELVEALRQVLGRAHAAAPHEVEAELLTVRDCMIAVMRQLEHHDSLEFEQVLGPGDGAAPSRARVVTTFLAVLELARLSALRVFQSLSERGVPRGPIRLLGVETAGAPWTERVAEIM